MSNNENESEKEKLSDIFKNLEINKIDPSALTTAALMREIANLKEIIYVRLDGMDKAESLHAEQGRVYLREIDRNVSQQRELQEARLKAIQDSSQLARENLATKIEAIEKSLMVFQKNYDLFPTRLDEKISAVSGVHDEQIRSIQTQFKERDTRTEQGARDSKVAVDAALSAQKESVSAQNASSALAISKSEASTLKQIEQLQIIINNSGVAITDKFDDVKSRLTRIESISLGKTTSDSTRQATNQWVIGLIVVGLLSAASLAASILHNLK